MIGTTPSRAVRAGLTAAGWLVVLGTGCGGGIYKEAIYTDGTQWHWIAAPPERVSRVDLSITCCPAASDLMPVLEERLRYQLTSRGVRLDSGAEVRLEVAANEFQKGRRGIPVRSKFMRLSLAVVMVRTSGERLLEGRCDGVTEESAGTWLPGGGRDRIFRVCDSAAGKLARAITGPSAASDQ